MKLVEKFEVHNMLNPKIWTPQNKLQLPVKARILEIVQQFKDACEFPLNIVDIHIVGSNASYNYTKYSDLDVHIVVNFDLIDVSNELLQTVYNIVKSKFNQDYDISIRGVDVELYVEDVRSTVVSNGVYSVVSDSWIKFPQKIVGVQDIDVSDEVREWSTKFDAAINSNSSQLIQKVIDDLYVVRKNSIDKEGEYGSGNQLFKEIRNSGLLDAAKEAYRKARSQELTLEHISLCEASRTNLIAQSKKSEKGYQRFKQRVKSRFATTVKEYNEIDMNKLFKQDVLTVNIHVKGETDDYTVKISFGGFLELLHDQLIREPFNLKAVTRALINGFNRDDVYIHCSCPDAKYRFAYWQTKLKTGSGDPETRPAKITNPNNTLGSSCKHVLLVLSNTKWLLKVASTIYNYVNYMEKHYERLYTTVIYPAIYQKEYEEPFQLGLFDDDELETDRETVDKSNVYAKTKNQFKPGNPYRAQPGKDNRQISLDDVGEDDLDS